MQSQRYVEGCVLWGQEENNLPFAILSVFPVALCHMSVWRDLQAQALALQRRLPRRVRVLGVDGVYPKLRGQEQPTLVCVDLGTGQPVALGRWGTWMRCYASTRMAFQSDHAEICSSRILRTGIPFHKAIST